MALHFPLTGNVEWFYLCGMDMKHVIASGGGLVKLARAVGLKHSSVWAWKRVPAEHAKAVEQATGIPRHELRPDLWEAPDKEAA